MSGSPLNLWDWLYRCAAFERKEDVACCLRGIRRDEFKRRYYEIAYGCRGATTTDLWIMRMIGEYHRLFPNCAIPDGYPVGHRFKWVEDIRTANFQRKESNMSQSLQPSTAKCQAPWQAAGPASVRIPGRPETLVTTYGQAPSPEDSIKQAEAMLAKAHEDIAERERRAELEKRLSYERALATATSRLLVSVGAIELEGGQAEQHEYLAKFRKELAPLAESYGFRIVLVGDKSVAVLTKVSKHDA